MGSILSSSSSQETLGKDQTYQVIKELHFKLTVLHHQYIIKVIEKDILSDYSTLLSQSLKEQFVQQYYYFYQNNSQTYILINHLRDSIFNDGFFDLIMYSIPFRNKLNTNIYQKRISQTLQISQKAMNTLKALGFNYSQLMSGFLEINMRVVEYISSQQRNGHAQRILSTKKVFVAIADENNSNRDQRNDTEPLQNLEKSVINFDIERLQNMEISEITIQLTILVLENDLSLLSLFGKILTHIKEMIESLMKLWNQKDLIQNIIELLKFYIDVCYILQKSLEKVNNRIRTLIINEKDDQSRMQNLQLLTDLQTYFNSLIDLTSTLLSVQILPSKRISRTIIQKNYLDHGFEQVRLSHQHQQDDFQLFIQLQ